MTESFIGRVGRRLDAHANKPFVVAIMGQTGVGKTSLVNTLFDADLPTSDWEPATKEVKPFHVEGTNGGTMTFYDMPGLGEPGDVSGKYLEDYKKYLLESDVVLWAIHSDSRSVSFDQASLNTLLSVDAEIRATVMSKIVFVLTKVDVLLPEPWVFGHDGPSGIFSPSAQLLHILAKKEQYFSDAFVVPNAEWIVARTHNDTGLRTTNAVGPLQADQYAVEYRGLMTRETLGTLIARFPRHEAIFERLYDCYRVIPCSSRFRYNLTQLMVQIVNRLGTDAIERFQRFITPDALNRLDVSAAKALCNLVVIDQASRRLEFDLRQYTFEGER